MVKNLHFIISTLAKRTGRCVYASLEGNINPSGTGYFWRKDGSVAKFSDGENCILLSESQGLAY